MHQLSSEMQKCIRACLNCYEVCRGAAMNHCLEVGGAHVEPRHFRLISACAEVCRATADLMLIGTRHHKHLCAECAEICEECADDCERLGDMQECVDACRRCAESCRRMAAM